MLKLIESATLAMLANAIDVGPVIENAETQESNLGSFSQSSCDTTNKFYVAELPDFRQG